MNDSSPFELSVSTFFDAAHNLLDERYGSGTRLHGHTYQVVVSMRGEGLRGDGMVFDHYAVRETIHRVVGQFHDRYLNDFPALRELDTTPEIIARHLWKLLADELAEHGVRTMSVEVAESPTMRVRFDAPLDPIEPGADEPA